jgi:hypothetical protein
MNIIEQANEILRKIGLKAIEVKLEQQVLPDGVTTIEAEVFEVGQPVFVVTEDAQIALPVGEYELADGRVLVVVEEGIIGEIREAAAEEPTEEEPVAEVPAEMSEPTAPQPKRTIESIVKETVFSKIEEQAAEIEKLKAELAALQPKEEVELSSDEPAAEPIVHNPEPVAQKEVFKFSTKKQESALDRVFAKLSK